MSAASQSNRTLWIALAANLGIAVSKFVAAAITGSSAMLTEGVHSVVDSTNQLLLMWGRRQSRKPPDKYHPFGYGRELYFWSFVAPSSSSRSAPECRSTKASSISSSPRKPSRR